MQKFTDSEDFGAAAIDRDVRSECRFQKRAEWFFSKGCSALSLYELDNEQTRAENRNSLGEETHHHEVDDVAPARCRVGYALSSSSGEDCRPVLSHGPTQGMASRCHV